ncbi:MFS transporter [Chitinophaga qingshengii]|uniref:MFS transporter n=1 Tax=Chitinophaga qingshengii TaxID=1569794 RepID=A0ABR7TUF2_9BACT|nr:MFS transporter [Chitinophaga qingshengii]MBC9933029.1 MFS transporter [Chitinophaga qingshengii]
MKLLKKENERICTIMAFALIPISGFAIDVYIPSFPNMVQDLHTTAAMIKLTMTVYLISYGLSQLLLGSLVDSYGRYHINLAALTVFTLSNIGIILTSSLPLILFLRGIQGIAIALIMVSRRVFFIDVYTGEKRAQYTSMLNVVWSTAPIIAPFAGGYLQTAFGWRSNFYFLAVYGLVMLLFELIYGGETIKERMTFHPRTIWNTYKTLFSTMDFSLGMVILGLSYGMVMVFGMTIPFIVEQGFHASPVVTGYCALGSGAAIFTGGLLAKRYIKKPFLHKLVIANGAQLGIALLMYVAGGIYMSIASIMVFVVFIHSFQGFTYNSYFTYCVTRFPQYAATASGLVSGGSYIIFSIASFLITSVITIRNQQSLSLSYILLIVATSIILWRVSSALKKQPAAVNTTNSAGLRTMSGIDQ